MCIRDSCTLHQANADRPLDVYRFFRDELGAQHIQFIPVIERVQATELGHTAKWSSWRDRPLYTQTGDHVTQRSITAEQFGRFLCSVFDDWVRRDVGRVYVQMFLSLIHI